MKYIYIIVILAAIAAGCKKSTLELENPNQITSATYWKTEDDVLSSFAATYALLRDVDGGYWGVRGIEFSNGRGDDFFIRNDVANLYQLSTFTNTPDNGPLTSFWNVSYRAIFRANQILENIDRVTTLDAAAKAKYIAEAKFLRGLNYFNLVINFGDVPLILTVPITTDQYFTAKSPETEVWKQVISDMTAASTDLPLTYDAKWIGRATRGAAIGFLGKALIYTKDWPNAEIALRKLTTAPYTYQLMQNYGDNFIASAENNRESVFEIQLADVGGTNPWAGENANQGLGVTTAQEFAPSEVSGWFEVSPTDKLFNEFKKERTISGDLDPRMYATLAFDYPGSTFYNRPWSNFKLLFGYSSMFKKYQNYNQASELAGTSGAGNYTSSNNERALRYADVLLLLAESLTMQGNTAAAQPYVTEIRNRANLPVLAAGLNQTQLMAEIRHQRMIELARENQRFYDLKRWGLLKQELDNSDKIGKQFYVAGKFDYFPIPATEVNSNQLMTQNPAW